MKECRALVPWCILNQVIALQELRGYGRVPQQTSQSPSHGKWCVCRRAACLCVPFKVQVTVTVPAVQGERDCTNGALPNLHTELEISN